MSLPQERQTHLAIFHEHQLFVDEHAVKVLRIISQKYISKILTLKCLPILLQSTKAWQLTKSDINLFHFTANRFLKCNEQYQDH